MKIVSDRIRAGIIVCGTTAITLVVLVLVLFSVRDLYRSLAQVRSLYAVDVKVLGLEGELQYQIQESRMRFLHLLMTATDLHARLRDIEDVRTADLQLSSLIGNVTVLTGDPARLQRIEKAWETYSDTRDNMIALALQGRFYEARALDKAQGVAAFDLASAALRQAKSELEESSAGKAEDVWGTMHRACFEILCLLIASLAFIGGLLGIKLKQIGMVRQLRLTAKTLSESEERFRRAFEEAAVGMVIMDPEGKILSLNKAVTEITGYSAGELVGGRGTVGMLDDHEATNAWVFGKIKRGETSTYRAERQIAKRDGTYAWVRTSASVLLRDGAPAEVIALCEDITEQKLAREHLSHEATHDSLTGLPNRRYFERALETAIAAARLQEADLALLYIDLDGFKLINDTLGHTAGDQLLRQVTERLRSCLDGPEFLARMGGDEFTVIQRFARGEAVEVNPSAVSQSAAQLGQRMLECLHGAFVVQGQEVSIGASIGIGLYPLDGADGSALLQCADAAMYHAKRNDSSGVYFFDAKMREAALRRLTIENQLRRALEREELYVEFQPLYEVSSSELIRFEALCRWHNPVLGEISPMEFIPAAEELGLIVDIGNWVLEQACFEARRWQEHGSSPIRIAVNVSTLQFADKSYVDDVQRILQATGFPAPLVELELTESILLHDQDETFLKMQRLRSLGVAISIDDFGTGYSSLSYLQNLPVDALKIDRSFIRKLDSSASAVSMVRSVIAMAHALGLRVATEGVETDRQFVMLRQLGADEAQGYYLGRPEGAESANQRVMCAHATSTPERQSRVSPSGSEDLRVLCTTVGHGDAMEPVEEIPYS